MITIKEFLETVEYKITDGSEYQWRSFGVNARFLDSSCDQYSASIIFDTSTQEVFIAEIFDNATNVAYRLINPAYKERFLQENKDNDTDPTIAFDDQKFTDLEVDEDWLEKASAIVRGETYDNRIQVPLTLNDDELFRLMKMAHENDITLNQMVERLLRGVMEGQLP